MSKAPITTATFMRSLEQAVGHVTLSELRKLCTESLWQGNCQMACMLALAGWGKFDTAKYLAIYQDVASSGIDPIRHYIEYGIQEKRLFPVLGQNATSTAQGRPKVSIVIPVYNNAKYLRECFDSALGQSLKDLEIIIVNDGSTDCKAIAIMKEYADKDKRIKLINKANTGYGHSMNVGIDNATGEYLGILESDDIIPIAMYEQLYALCEKSRLDFVRTDYQTFYGKKESRDFYDVKIYKCKSQYNIVTNSLDHPELMIADNVIWNGLYSLRFIRDNKIRFNETPGASFQDNGFCMLTFVYARRFMYSDLKTYMVRRDNSDSSVFGKNKGMAIVKEYDYIEKSIRKLGDTYNIFLPYIHKKRYSNYVNFAIPRTNKQFRQELLASFKSHVRRSREHGELKDDVLGSYRTHVQQVSNNCYPEKWLKTPELSVIVPVYNAGKYLKQCLDSILDQTFNDFELICVDDGSTDESVKILHDYAHRNKRIKLFRQENTGAGSARNLGLKHASGEYISFLDADDYFDTGMLDAMLNRCKMFDADFCVCESDMLFPDGKQKRISSINYQLLPDMPHFSSPDIKSNIFRSIIGWAWDKLYKRDFICKYKLVFPLYRSSEDMGFVFPALLSAKRITILSQRMVIHRTGVSTSIEATLDKHPLNFIYSLQYIQEYMKNNNMVERWRADLADYAIHAFLWNFKTLKGEAALKLYKYKDDFAAQFDIDRIAPMDFFDKCAYNEFISL